MPFFVASGLFPTSGDVLDEQNEFGERQRQQQVDQDNLDEWRSWAMAIAGTTQAQKEAMEAASDHAQERLSLAAAPATPRRPAPAGA